jgi:hypothetical protein
MPRSHQTFCRVPVVKSIDGWPITFHTINNHRRCWRMVPEVDGVIMLSIWFKMILTRIIGVHSRRAIKLGSLTLIENLILESVRRFSLRNANQTGYETSLNLETWCCWVCNKCEDTTCDFVIWRSYTCFGLKPWVRTLMWSTLLIMHTNLKLTQFKINGILPVVGPNPNVVS